MKGSRKSDSSSSFRRRPACMDAGGRAAPACCRQVGNRPPRNPVVYIIHSRSAGMTAMGLLNMLSHKNLANIDHNGPVSWIPRPSFQTCLPACLLQAGGRQARLYHPALAGTPPEEGNWNHLGGCSRPACSRQARLYRLHPCRRASMQAGLRRNDGVDKKQIPAPL